MTNPQECAVRETVLFFMHHRTPTDKELDDIRSTFREKWSDARLDVAKTGYLLPRRWFLVVYLPGELARQLMHEIIPYYNNRYSQWEIVFTEEVQALQDEHKKKQREERAARQRP